MGYPTVHGPDTQAHQNVVAFVVVGCYRPHQIERSYVPLVQDPIIESIDRYKKSKFVTALRTHYLMAETSELNVNDQSPLSMIDNLCKTYHHLIKYSHCPFPYRSHLH